MSDKRDFDIMNYLRFWVARFANWFCGPEVLFWDSPEEWEEYMSMGKPYVASDDADAGPDPYVLQQMYNEGYARGRHDAAVLEKMRKPTP